MTTLTAANPAAPDWRWVEAAPFRALVDRLLRETGLPWRAIAGLAVVPDQVIRSLISGRDGRPTRRIAPHYAWRLYCLTPAGVRAELATPEHPARARSAARRLRAAGWPVPALAIAAGLTDAETRLLLDGAASAQPLRVRLLLEAAVRAERGRTDIGAVDAIAPVPTAA